MLKVETEVIVLQRHRT